MTKGNKISEKTKANEPVIDLRKQGDYTHCQHQRCRSQDDGELHVPQLKHHY